MTEEDFDELRPPVFAIAYRMLGSVSEAEDVVQDGFLRLHRARTGGDGIESPRAYLPTVVSQLSLDQLRPAGVGRGTYVGERLPEPLVSSADDDPAWWALDMTSGQITSISAINNPDKLTHPGPAGDLVSLLRVAR